MRGMPFVDRVMGKKPEGYGTGEFLMKPGLRKRDRFKIGKGDMAVSEVPKISEQADPKVKPKSKGQILVQRMLANAGGRRLGPDTNGWEYQSGQFKGMNKAQATQKAVDLVRSGQYDGTRGESGADAQARRLQARLNGRANRPNGARSAAAAREQRMVSGFRVSVTDADRAKFAKQAKARREYFGGGDYDPAKDEGIIVENKYGDFASGTRIKGSRGTIHGKGPHAAQEGIEELPNDLEASKVSDRRAKKSKKFPDRLLRSVSSR